MRVFWDTYLFIYLWENSALRTGMETLLAWQDGQRAEVVTSTLTLGELLVRIESSCRESRFLHLAESFHER